MAVYKIITLMGFLSSFFYVNMIGDKILMVASLLVMPLIAILLAVDITIEKSEEEQVNRHSVNQYAK